eukprot:gene25537-30833_t
MLREASSRPEKSSLSSSFNPGFGKDQSFLYSLQHHPLLNPKINASTTIFSTALSHEHVHIHQPNSTWWRKELAVLRSRVEKLEKTISSLSSNQVKAKQPTAVNSFVDAITANTIQMNSKTVEICAVTSYFLLGMLIGYSLFDRLWLLGGIAGAWWAASIVHRNSPTGRFARKLGVKVARVVIDLQEKYNQAVIFYRTGKLAYVSSKIWENYDQKFSITHKMNTWKKLAMDRAVALNQSKNSFLPQISDFYRVVLSTPEKVESKYKVRESVEKAVKVVGDGVKEGGKAVREFFDFGDEVGSDSIQVGVWRSFPSREIATIRKNNKNGGNPKISSGLNFRLSPALTQPTTTPLSPLLSLYALLLKSVQKAFDTILDKDTLFQSKQLKSTSWIRNPFAPPIKEKAQGVHPVAQKVIAVAWLLMLLEAVRWTVKVGLKVVWRIVK